MSPVDFSIVALISAVFFAMFLVIRSVQVRSKEELSEMDDSMPEQGEVKAMNMNGHTMFLSESDIPVWKSLTNKQRQEAMLKQRALIKGGFLVKVTDENGKDGLITKAEALDKGVLVQYIDKNGNTTCATKKEFDKIKTKL